MEKDPFSRVSDEESRPGSILFPSNAGSIEFG